ncbi:DUF6588 family protein [Rhodohalobacter barkolensis]|uniref:Uncharacterized protein n=1 Tax=Rhodohalobacter barkolensis TaxID=2053187 RepID=A0A2N0VKV8_9BACT|nr:DUF6588 family protein [Rhodohalobacter barkolensis]PKD44835.1 hypothetical protein CWD77_05070 [Rhodohalobacter barkolensis]
MKTVLQLKKVTLFVSTLLLISLAGVQNAAAQFDDAGEILRSGTNDANLLLQEYLKPFANGFGADLNSGWINSARPYRKLGFDLRISAGVAIVPTGDRSFNVDELDFENLDRVGGPAEAQTAFGEDVAGPEMGIFGTNPVTGLRQEITRFTMPEGTGYPFVPAPMIQGTVGIVKDTDVSLRYMPTVTVEDINTSLFGFGVKHGLNQWLPGGSVLPVDLSVQLGYTKLTSDFGFEVNPEEGQDIYNPYAGNPSLWEGQSIDMEATGFTGNILVGKNLPIISVYGGIGFQSSEMTLNSPGSYPVTVFNEDYDPLDGSEETREKIIERLDEPINLSFDGSNSIHALAGFRLRLSLLTISGSYTLSNYPVANIGVGLSFR